MSPHRPRLALVYDLKEDYLARGFDPEDAAEFDERVTIDALAEELARVGFRPDRVGDCAAFACRLAKGERWDVVWSIAEGWRGACREAQAATLCDLYGLPHFFSDALALSLAHHKGVAKTVVAGAGGRTAPFAVVHHPDDFASVDLPFPVYVKPVAEGSSKGVGVDARVDTSDALVRVGQRLLARFRQPVLVEAYLPGDEYTVAVFGAGATARAVGVMKIEFIHPDAGQTYSLSTKADYKRLVRYVLADDAVAEACGRLAVLAHRALGCRDVARHDIRLDASGAPCFLETNPLPGLNPEYSDLPIMASLAGRRYSDLIDALVAEAAPRLNLAHPAD